MDYVLELRKEIGHRPLLVVGSACMILNENNELLLIKRTDNGLWGIVAGSTELNETVEQTAVREAYEETGLIVDPDDLEFLKVFSGPGYEYTYPNGDHCHFVTIAFLTRKYTGELVLETNETSNAKFFDLDHLPENIHKTDRMIAQLIQQLHHDNDNKHCLEIRSAIPSDAEKLVKYINQIGGESDQLLFGENQFEFSVEQQREFIKSIAESGNKHLIVAKINDKIIGCASLISSDRERISHVAELSISISRDYWNRGYGSQLLSSTIAIAKGSEFTRLITLKVRTDNTIAINLCQKFGFRNNGVIRNYIKIDEQYYDVFEMILQLGD